LSSRFVPVDENSGEWKKAANILRACGRGVRGEMECPVPLVRALTALVILTAVESGAGVAVPEEGGVLVDETVKW